MLPIRIPKQLIRAAAERYPLLLLEHQICAWSADAASMIVAGKGMPQTSGLKAAQKISAPSG